MHVVLAMCVAGAYGLSSGWSRAVIANNRNTTPPMIVTEGREGGVD